MKNICIIITGGTFLMNKNDCGNGLSPMQSEEILNYIPELKSIAHTEVKHLFNIDSVNIQREHWLDLADFIQKNQKEYDGFVIIHGTDTMTYTASALSFTLQGLNKPIILTGAMRPITKDYNDAASNLTYSVKLATYEIPEVCIFFGTHLFRGNRTIKISSSNFNAFISPNYYHLAEVGLDISLNHNALSKQKAVNLNSNFNAKVICLKYFPGFTDEGITKTIINQYDAIILESLGTGSLPYSDNTYLSFIEKATALNKLVVISSQCPYGGTNLRHYNFQSDITKAGAISNLDMTTDASIVKAMYLLGALKNDRDKVRDLFTINIAGELTNSK